MSPRHTYQRATNQTSDRSTRIHPIQPHQWLSVRRRQPTASKYHTSHQNDTRNTANQIVKIGDTKGRGGEGEAERQGTQKERRKKVMQRCDRECPCESCLRRKGRVVRGHRLWKDQTHPQGDPTPPAETSNNTTNDEKRQSRRHPRAATRRATKKPRQTRPKSRKGQTRKARRGRRQEPQEDRRRQTPTIANAHVDRIQE